MQMTTCEDPDSPRLEPHTYVHALHGDRQPTRQEMYAFICPQGKGKCHVRNSGGVQSMPQHSFVKFLFSVLYFQHTSKKKPGCGQGWPPPRCTQAASARAESCAPLQRVRGAGGNNPAFQLRSYGQEGTKQHLLVLGFSKSCFRFTSESNV